MGLAIMIDLPEWGNGRLGIWELTESCDYLLQHHTFTPAEIEQSLRIKNERRRREYLSVRLLIESMLKNKTGICYNASGKPSLEGLPDCVTIAHSNELAAVLISEKNAGADVESLYRNTENIASRFLSEKELEQINNSSQQKLYRIIYWSAKEAAYKLASVEGLEFRENIAINHFDVDMKGGTFSGEIRKNEMKLHLSFRYFFYNDNVLVICTDENDIINNKTTA